MHSAYCAQHDASIDSLLLRSSPERMRAWDTSFVRIFNDCKVEIVASFFHLLSLHNPSRMGPDRMRWKFRKNEDL